MRRYVSKLQLGLERKRNEFDVVASTFDASMLCYDTCTYRITRFDDDERFEYDGCPRVNEEKIVKFNFGEISFPRNVW